MPIVNHNFTTDGARGAAFAVVLDLYLMMGMYVCTYTEDAGPLPVWAGPAETRPTGTSKHPLHWCKPGYRCRCILGSITHGG
jgi:hypothetical protein